MKFAIALTHLTIATASCVCYSCGGTQGCLQDCSSCASEYSSAGRACATNPNRHGCYTSEYDGCCDCSNLGFIGFPMPCPEAPPIPPAPFPTPAPKQGTNWNNWYIVAIVVLVVVCVCCKCMNDDDQRQREEWSDHFRDANRQREESVRMASCALTQPASHRAPLVLQELPAEIAFQPSASAFQPSAPPASELQPQSGKDCCVLPEPPTEIAASAIAFQPSASPASALQHSFQGELPGKEDCCVVCMVAPLEYACIPCGHMCGCQPCLSKVRACPICRQNVQQVVRIFSSAV